MLVRVGLVGGCASAALRSGRSLLITGVLFATLAAQIPMPRNIAMSGSFGNPGQVGLFIAASDGSDERPPLDSKGSDYDPVWAPDGSSIDPSTKTSNG